MDMYSPSDGTSPCETPGAYMPMSPGKNTRVYLFSNYFVANLQWLLCSESIFVLNLVLQIMKI